MRRSALRRPARWTLGVACLFVLLQPDGLDAQERAFPRFLRLSDAIDIAVEGSTQLGIQQARLDAAKTSRLNAWFSLGPDVRVNFVDQRATRKDFDLPREVSLVDSIATLSGRTVLTTIPTGETFTEDFTEESSFRQLQVQSSVRLFDGFANYARIRAANRDVQANDLNLKYTRTTVTQNVIEAYYNLLRAKLLLRVAQESEAVSREQLERTEALYELGSAARSDVLKSQVQLGQTRLELVQARNRERQARDDLVFAMNLTSAPPFEIDTTITTIPEESFDFDSEKSYALAHRLDLQAQRETEKAENSRVWAARGALLPTLDFQYSFSSTDQESQFRFGSAETQNRSWAITSNWNVFDRYLTYANISNAKAQRRIAEYNRKQAELDAIREIRQHVNSLREARERLQVARENVERSREDLRLAQEKFRVGAGTILDTITAESDLTATKGAEVEAIVDYLIARAKLARATGRPFQE